MSDHPNYYKREYILFKNSSARENAANLLHFCNSLAANKQGDTESIMHLDYHHKRELSHSSPSCNNDNVSLFSSTFSVHTKSQFASDEDSIPDTPCSSLSEDEKNFYTKGHHSILPQLKTLSNQLFTI